VLEPQGTVFFLLLLVAFGGLVTWLVLSKQVVFRVLAACLAFIPAMVFGIAAVNKYYDYYQTWNGLFSDLSGQAQSVPQLSAASLGGTPASLRQALGASNNAGLDAHFGLLFQTTIASKRTHITRQVYIYLPPQYFSPSYAKYRFPAIELLHGSPGKPSTWVDVMDVIPIYLQLLAQGKASPAVLVMPDTDGGQRYALQCLNNPHGIQDMTYIGKDVPNWVAANLRVMRPGIGWGVAGYSEGGFCAANIGLQDPTRFGYAGVLSGYFNLLPSQVPANGKPGGPPRDVYVYQHYRQLALRNTPDEYVTRIPIGVVLPKFFLAAGAADIGDVRDAQFFRQQLLLRVANVPLVVIPGGGHQARVWRAALAPLLEWMTPQLTATAQQYERMQARREARMSKELLGTVPPIMVHPPKATPTR
jgi:enterochelin esterase-like enzyme